MYIHENHSLTTLTLDEQTNLVNTLEEATDSVCSTHNNCIQLTTTLTLAISHHTFRLGVTGSSLSKALE